MSTSTRISPERSAKHSLPTRSPSLLRRQRLLDFLHENIDRKLLLISAAAGYGKTSLLLDFAGDTDLPVAWLALDEGDRDLAVFLADVLTSLRGPFPEFGETTEALLRQSAAGIQPQQAATVLAREFEDTIDSYFILCLDDYHLIDDTGAVDVFMDRLLDLLPEHAHLLIASRSLPPLPIVQLAARQQIAGLSEEQLRFTAAEVQALLRLRNDVALPDAEAEQLASHTEGWITGILLSSHLMWKGLVATWLRARQADAPVFDYLAGEVLAGQPEGLREFLLESSILPEMDAEICDSILGRTDSASMLRQAESRRLFTTVIGEEVRAFAYHHLFREFLLSRLRATRPERLRELQRRAGECYQAMGWPETALTFYLAAAERERAIAIAEENAEGLFYGGRYDTLRRWGELLAECAVEAPTLHLFLSKVHTDTGNLSSAELALATAREGFDRQQNQRGAISVVVQRSLLSYRQGRFEEALALGLEGYRSASVAGFSLQAGAAQRNAGLSHLALGSLAAAQEALTLSAGLFEQSGHAYERAWALHDLALVLRSSGQTARAAQAQQEALAIWREGGHLGPLAMALNNVGMDQHMLGQYQAALATYAEAMDRARQSGSGTVEVLVLAGQGDLLAELGDLPTAEELFRRAMGLTEAMKEKGLLSYLCRAQARLERWRGNYAAALEWLRRAQLASASPDAAAPGTEVKVLEGSTLLEMGYLEEARTSLRKTCAKLEMTGALVDLTHGLMCLAHAEYKCKDEEKAISTLRLALQMAERVGYDQMLVAEALPSRDLLVAVQRTPDIGPRAASLLARAEAAQTILGADREIPTTAFRPTPASLEVRALGGSRVLKQGTEITRRNWISQQTRELFLYIVDNAPVRREALLQAFWPEMRAPRATDNFHQTMSRMRRAVGPDVVVFDQGEYRLAPALDLDYDVARFEQGARAALALPAGHLRRPSALAAAIDLYTGEYVSDLSVEWAAIRRQALCDLFVATLSAYASELVGLARYADARQALERALSTDPLRDDLHLEMLRCLSALGRRDEVVRHYRQYRETLRAELGLEPAAEARALYARLIS